MPGRSPHSDRCRATRPSATAATRSRCRSHRPSGDRSRCSRRSARARCWCCDPPMYGLMLDAEPELDDRDPPSCRDATTSAPPASEQVPGRDLRNAVAGSARPGRCQRESQAPPGTACRLLGQECRSRPSRRPQSTPAQLASTPGCQRSVKSAPTHRLTSRSTRRASGLLKLEHQRCHRREGKHAAPAIRPARCSEPRMTGPHA